MSVLVGIQLGAISLLDEGVGGLLDTVQEQGAVNSLFLSTQAFDRGVQGRQVPWRPWPGHGPKELDDHWGGSYVTQHDEFYGGTVLGPYRAPDQELAGFDALAELLPQAHDRGLTVYSFVLENTHSGLARAVPNWPKVLQEDAWGRADAYACLRNPDYIIWWLGIVEDQVKSYPIDGLMFGAERNGPLGNVLGNGGFARDGLPYCFCRWCVEAGIQRGIDPLRAREGYRLLYRLARGEDSTEPGADSAFVRFLRLLTTYPEIIAWDSLWHDGYQSLQKRIYGTVKLLAPTVQVGWHVWHHNSFSPLYRAQMDYTEIAEYSDFVKPVLYNNAAGYRFHAHIREVSASIFAGVPEEAVYALYRSVLGYDEDMPFADLPGRGLSADYVLRETRRTVAAVDSRAAVYPGLDVDVPTPEHVKKTDPGEITAAIQAAMDGGADGFILSRKYSEMSVENLKAAGTAARSVQSKS